MDWSQNLTTVAGILVADNQNSLTPPGPLLVQDLHPFEKHAHFNRERIPERVVHAKGSAAHGTFTVTRDITHYTRAVGGPVEDPSYREPPLNISGAAHRYDHRSYNNDYGQAGVLFRLMSEDQQYRLMDNIAAFLTGGPDVTTRRQIAHFTKADPVYGAGVAKRLDLSTPTAAE